MMTTPPPSDVTAADVKGTIDKGYVVSSIMLPQQKSDFALDLNGDKRADNALGNIIGTLATQGLDAQTGVNASVEDGTVQVLLSLTSSDPKLAKADDAVKLTFYLGKGKPGMFELPDGVTNNDAAVCVGCPDFSGMGMFMADASTAQDFFARIKTAGHFTSNDPVTTTHPVTIHLKVAIIEGAAPLDLTINGAHVQFEIGMNAAGATTLEKGQIHGSIKKADVDGTIIPAVATLLTGRICPGGVMNHKCMGACNLNGSNGQIASIFDSGNCSNGDGTMAMMKDCVIDTCEVAGNSIITAVLASDVQIYDAKGDYAPSAANMKKDSLSLGLGFTAVAGTVMK